MKVHFGTKTVQKMGRIAMTEPLLRNAGLKEGDTVELFFDAATKAIVVERSVERAASANEPIPAGAQRAPRKKAR